MQLISLELENIKSYAARTRIDLTPGLNAICGRNGSGKTTVLEAIGFALFDFLPYKQSFFVREGQRTGTVRVRLEARDGREYEVVRKVGMGSAYYVADVETDMRLCERGEQVLEWMRTQALDIEAGTQLKSLFEKAVGVPQGTMTADFLGQTGTRKAIFDPLLRVEEYQKAWEYLREAGSNLRDRAQQVENEIVRLLAGTEQIPAKMAQLEAARNVFEESVRRITVLERDLADLQTGEKVLSTLQAKIQELSNEERDAQYDVNRRQDALSAEETRLTQAQKARRIVSEAEPGYREALAARKQLAALTEQRARRDALNGQLNGATARRDGVYGRIERLDQEFREAREARQQAAALTEDVARQQELEERLRELTAGLDEVQRLDTQCGRLQKERGDCAARLEAGERSFRESVAAEAEAQHLPAAQAHLTTLGEQLAAFGPLAERRDEVKAVGADLRKQRTALVADVERRRVLQRQIDELTPLAANLDPLLVQQRSLHNEQARNHAAREYQMQAREELQRAHCPLLELRCPVVSADPNTLARFSAREEALALDAERLIVELAGLEQEVTLATGARNELQGAQLEAAHLERSEQMLVDLEGQLRGILERYQELSAQLEHDGEWRAEHRTLTTEVRRLEALSRVAGQRTVLEEQVRRDAELLTCCDVELVDLTNQRAALDGVERIQQETRASWEALNDPRRRQQALLGLAQRIPRIENDLQGQHVVLAEAAGAVTALHAELAAFERLDEDERAAQASAEAAQADHDRYVRHHDEASAVEERAAAVAAAEQAFQEAQALLLAIQQQRDEAKGQYDVNHHNDLIASCREMEHSLTRLRSERQHAEDELRVVEKDLADLQVKEVRRRAQQVKREELEETKRALEFVRETIRQAGPAITEAVLRNVSMVANDIYAEIIDDHAAELRWEPTYEIVVQRSAEEREFSQLSGGEQMSAALAVRLALLKEMSAVDFAFFDEPTQNMDGERRGNLADQIRAVRGFDQVIVISHDDTFEHHTDNLIRLRKDHEETRLDTD